MTEEELKNATGQELIEQRDYCGADSYYRDYLDNVNTEMLKRFNRLTELETENEQLKQQIERMKCCENCKHHSFWGNELKCNLLDYNTEFECLKSKNKWELINE